MTREPEDFTVSDQPPQLGSLVPEERDVRTGRIGGGRSRQDKHRHEQSNAAAAVRAGTRVGRLVAVGAALVLVGGGVAYGVARSTRGHGDAPTGSVRTPPAPSATATDIVPAAAAFSGVYDVRPGLNGVIDGVHRLSGATTWTVKPRCSSGACAVDISFSNGGHSTYAYVNGGWRYQFKDKSGCQHGVLTITLVPGKVQTEGGVAVLSTLSGLASNRTRACGDFEAVSDDAHETFVRRPGS